MRKLKTRKKVCKRERLRRQEQSFVDKGGEYLDTFEGGSIKATPLKGAKGSVLNWSSM